MTSTQGNEVLAPDSIRLAVASDLHCYSVSDPDRSSKGWPTPSYSCADTSAPDREGDPISHLEALVESAALTADFFLCPGDLGDHASPTGIKFAWDRLSRIAKKMGNAQLIATAGNHDINYGQPEPTIFLKELSPTFPLEDNALRAAYWTDHYAIFEAPNLRLVCLNSSAHHHAITSPEREHGRIIERTQSALKTNLGNLAPKPVQVLLCHHHPHQHCDFKLGEKDVMVEGQRLLDILSKNGNWLVVHGHKHHPKLTHAAGGSVAPWVFAAGSLAAHPNPATVGHSANQFYMIDFEPNTFAINGWGGRIRVWDWVTEDGWQRAAENSGLPAEVGFGFLGDIGKTAAIILQKLPERNANFVYWAELVKTFPWLLRLCPLDLKALEPHGISIQNDSNGVPWQIGRAK